MSASGVMDAGQEMDCLIAERVFGERVERESGCLWLDGPEPMRLTRPLPAYSTDIAAAFLVVNHLKRTDRRGFEDFQLIWGNFGGLPPPRPGGQLIESPAMAWLCTFDRNVGQDATADTAPLAICRAALLALGVVS